MRAMTLRTARFRASALQAARGAILFAAAAAAAFCWSTPVHPASADDGSIADLAVTVAPPVLSADGSSQPVLYVQALGDDSHPILVSSALEVALFSSNPSAVRVPGRVQIPPGSSYVIVPLTTTLTPGAATITAVGQGKSSTGVRVETVASGNLGVPVGVELHVAPPKLLSGAEPPAKLAVLLVDGEGQAVKAQETVDVLITSSNPDAVKPPSRMTVLKGEYFATADLEQGEPGEAILTAILPGYLSSPTQVTVAGAGGAAETLEMYILPDTLRSGGRARPMVVVQAVDLNGKPVPFPCTTVHLASSAPDVASIPPLLQVNCETGLQYVSVPLRTGSTPGTASLTAASTGLRPATASVSLRRQVPSQLNAFLGPGKLLGVEGAPGFLAVQVVDANGIPVTDHGGIAATLAGQGKTLEDVLVIPDGRSFVMMGLGESREPVEWWILGPGLLSTRVSATWADSATRIDVTLPDGPMYPGEEKEIQATVLSGGIPVAGADLNWTATRGSLRYATRTTDENGQATALLLAGEAGDGTITVSASKPGYVGAEWAAPVSVVAAGEKAPVAPTLGGLPVLYWFLALGALLVGYLVATLRRRFRPHRGPGTRAARATRRTRRTLESLAAVLRLPRFVLPAPRQAPAARKRTNRVAPARKRPRKAPAPATTAVPSPKPAYAVALDDEESSSYETRLAEETRGLGKVMAHSDLFSADDRQLLEAGAAVRALEEVARARLEGGDIPGALSSTNKAITWADLSDRQSSGSVGGRKHDRTHLWLLLASIRSADGDAIGARAALENAKDAAERAGRYPAWADSIAAAAVRYASGRAA